MLPNFSYGDAIGNHTLALREALRRRGFESDIFAHYTHERLEGESSYHEDYADLDDPGNLLVYHYSIGSVVTGFFGSLACRKVMIYHNITPPSFFEGVNRRAARECEFGLREMDLLLGEVELALGDSEFNRLELEERGFSPTGVLPIFVPFEDYGREADAAMMRRLGDGAANLLHVGRIAPNKRIEDLVKAFCFLRKTRPEARLVVAGTDVNMENYSAAVRKLADDLGIGEAVLFTGHITFGELLACYRTASVYLTMSEHEGFCVPLVEAMITGVPVVAYASSAVPGTLDGAGILFSEKDYPLVAGILDEVIGNGELRDRLVRSGRERLAFFGRENRERMLDGHLRSLGLSVPRP